jgi:hypothetical protein
VYVPWLTTTHMCMRPVYNATLTQVHPRERPLTGPSTSFSQRTLRFLYFPVRKSSPTDSPRDPPLSTYQRIGTHSFASSLTITRLLNPSRPDGHSTLTLSSWCQDFCFAGISLLVISSTMIFRLPIPDALLSFL